MSLLLAALAGTALAQTGPRPAAGAGDAQLRGRVLDAQTGEALPGATVALPDLARGAVAAGDGSFALGALPAGTHRLECTYIGYEAARRTIVLATGQAVEVELRLVVQAVSLREVTVTPGRFAIMGRQPQARQVLTEEQIQAIPHFGEDIYRAVTRLPGISGSDYSARFTVRGGEHDEVLVLLDGIQLYEPFHLKDIGGGALSVVDVEAIEGIDLLTGGFPAEYGDRMSGVFDITSRTPRPGTQHASVGLSFMNARAASEGTFRNGSWLVSARRGYLDLVLWLMQEDGSIEPRYYDVLGKVECELTPSQRLSAHVLYAQDEFDVVEDDADEYTTGYGNAYVWLRLTSTPTAALLGRTLLSLGRVNSDRHGDARLYDEKTPEYTVSDRRSFGVVGLQQAWSWEASARHLLTAGADLRRLAARYDYVSVDNDWVWLTADSLAVRTDTLAADLRPDGYSLGLHLSDRLRLHRRLTAEVGLRYDQATRTGDRLWSPRLNAVVTLGAGVVLRGGWGLFQQMQGLNELSVQDGERGFAPAQRSEQWALGLEQLLPGGVQLRLEAYDRRLTHLQRDYRNWLNDLEIFPELQDDRFGVDRRASTSRGVEVYAKRDRGGRFTWWASYALARAREHVTAIVTPDGALPLRVELPGFYDQRHTVYVDVNWRPVQAWHVNAAWQYRSGWPYTRMVSAEGRRADGSVYYNTRAGQPHGDRYPPFHRLDLRLSRLWRTRGGRLAVFAEVVNLYDHANVRTYHYRWERVTDTRWRLVQMPQHWFRLLPSLGASWSWER